MAKMCKWHKKSGLTECDFQDTKSANPFGNCPKNTNSRCQIITRREKMVKVKAWCVVRDSNTGEIDGCFESGNIPPKHFSSAYVPCTILIAAKYLRGGK